MKVTAAKLRASWTFCLGAMLLTAGCATPIKTDYKSGTDFSRYKTFALMPLPQQASAEDPGLVLRLAQPARDAVVSDLTAKGLTEAASAQADLSVNLRGQSLPKVEVRDYGYTYPAMTRYGTVTVVRNPYTSVSTYNERTLIIEILDNRAKELVWVGWVKKESSKPVTAEALQQAIREVLAEFPPPPPALKKTT
jgi:hypothetical protein